LKFNFVKNQNSIKNQETKTQKDYIINKIDIIGFGFQRRNSFSFIQNNFPFKIDVTNNNKKQEGKFFFYLMKFKKNLKKI
jgi:hypothetical protein